MAGPTKGHLLHFWRGARRRNRIWWSSLADAPEKPLVLLGEVIRYFLAGIGIAVLATFILMHLDLW
jgi:hypothetical protein